MLQRPTFAVILVRLKKNKKNLTLVQSIVLSQKKNTAKTFFYYHHNLAFWPLKSVHLAFCSHNTNIGTLRKKVDLRFRICFSLCTIFIVSLFSKTAMWLSKRIKPSESRQLRETATGCRQRTKNEKKNAVLKKVSQQFVFIQMSRLTIFHWFTNSDWNTQECFWSFSTSFVSASWSSRSAVKELQFDILKTGKNYSLK